MHVLLATLNAKYIHTNLAIRLLYEGNKDRAKLEWKEFTIKESRDAIAAYCRQFDLVAFSCYIWNITQTLDTARRIKALNPAVKILLGGPEVSYDWQDVIARAEVDFIITGEGEIPFREFLEAYPRVEQVANLVRKEQQDVFYTPQTAVFDLEEYRHVLPYRNDPVEELGRKVLYVETSRGCPYKCEFCLASLDNKVRYLPMEHIRANLLYLMEHGRVIKFLDRTFNIKKAFTLEVFQFILEHHRPGNVFQFEITADILHPDIIRFIHDHVPKGLFRFEIGIQTVNQQANLAVQRKQDFEKTKHIIQALEHKVEMHLDLIVGLPLDYWDDIRYSFEAVFKLFPPELQLGFLKFLKGTPMRDKEENHGFVFDPEPPYQIIESKYLSRGELRQIEILEHALEIYWNKKKAINTLRYVTGRYSIFDFLSGLGTHFGKTSDFHRFSLQEVYEILYSYAVENYPQDTVLKELIDLDYHIQHKVKPKDIFLRERPAAEKNRLLLDLQLDTQKFRYAVLPLSFDFRAFEERGVVEPGAFHLVIQYSGADYPEMVGCVAPDLAFV